MDDNAFFSKAKNTLEKSTNAFVDYIENIYNPTIESGDEDEIKSVTKERDRLFQQKEYWSFIVRAINIYVNRATPVTQDFMDGFIHLKRIQIIMMFKELTEKLKNINNNIYIQSHAGLYPDENIVFGEICLNNVQGIEINILKPNGKTIQIIEDFFKEKNIKIAFNTTKNCFVLKNVIIDLQKIN